MKFSDLYDQIAGQSGDDSSSYRADARRWMNLTRTAVADEAFWMSALDANASFITSAAITTGFYTLSGYEFIFGDWLFDETNNLPLKYASLQQLNATDPDKSHTGSPDFWADAGKDSKGQRELYLWPIPDGTYTIRFNGYQVLDDVTEAQDGLSLDPFFGELNNWQHCFSEGMRYYHLLDNNEDETSTQAQWGRFMRAIKRRKSRNSVSPHGTFGMDPIRTQAPVVVGRFPPGHFNNRAQ